MLAKTIKISLALFVLYAAGYCMIAGLASGGSYVQLNRDSDVSWSEAVEYSTDFYNNLRLVVILASGVVIVVGLSRKELIALWLMLPIVVVYNPWLPVRLSKDAFETIDIIASLLLLCGSGYVGGHDKGTEL